jgi:hypothetical protein
MTSSWNDIKDWIRVHFFRAWTAGAVLAGYVYCWVYFPELLTWWKRTTTSIIETTCGLLPYPWGDRVEATLGNFGLWVQVTLAIIAFRVVIWSVMSLSRRIWAARSARSSASPPMPSESRQ